MRKGKFERTKPHVNVGTIATLTTAAPLTAITTVLSTVRRRSQLTRSMQLLKKRHAASPSTPRTSSTTESRHYAHVDCPGHVDCREHDHAPPRWTARSWSSAADGPMPQTREHILLSRQVGVPYIIVFLNKADMVDDAELLELVEMEVRELLSVRLPGRRHPDRRVRQAGAGRRQGASWASRPSWPWPKPWTPTSRRLSVPLTARS